MEVQGKLESGFHGRELGQEAEAAPPAHAQVQVWLHLAELCHSCACLPAAQGALRGHLFNTQVALEILSAGEFAAVAAEDHAAGQVAYLLQALGAASQVGLHRGLPITV